MLKGLRERLKLWKQKRSWFKLAEWKASEYQLLLLAHQVWEAKEEEQHQLERKKLMKRIDKAKQDYIA